MVAIAHLQCRVGPVGQPVKYAGRMEHRLSVACHEVDRFGVHVPLSAVHDVGLMLGYHDVEQREVLKINLFLAKTFRTSALNASS